MTEGTSALTPTDYIAHHLGFLEKQVGSGSFWTIHVDSVVTGLVLGFIGLGFLWWVVRGATAGVPNKRQAFVELATGWGRLISRNAAKLSYQPGIGRLTLPLLSSAEHFTGRHQLAALATLDSYTNLPHWNSLLVARQPIALNNDGPDSVILGSLDSRQDELIRIINARRQILGQSRTVRVALALREAQLQSPSTGKSQWLQNVTNQPSLSPFAQGFGVSAHFGNMPGNLSLQR